MDVLTLSFGGAWQGKECIDEVIDLLSELARIDLCSQLAQGFPLLIRDGVGVAEAIERGSGLTVAAQDARRAVRA